MKLITDVFEEIANNSGMKQFIFGHIEEMAAKINGISSANLEQSPSLWLLQDFAEYYDPYMELHYADLNLLITISADNTLNPENRKPNMRLLNQYYKDVMNSIETSYNIELVKKIKKIDRPKVKFALGEGNSQAQVFNECLDGIEILLTAYFDLDNCHNN